MAISEGEMNCENPGIIIILYSGDTKIQNCGSLAFCATLTGAWRNKPIHLTSPQPGATAALSKLAFMNWMDNVINRETRHNPLAYYEPGSQSEWGFYYHMLLDEFLEITGALSNAFGK